MGLEVKLRRRVQRSQAREWLKKEQGIRQERRPSQKKPMIGLLFLFSSYPGNTNNSKTNARNARNLRYSANQD